MARSKNSLTDVSPGAGQFKNSYSISEKTILNGLGNGDNRLRKNSYTNLNAQNRSNLDVGIGIIESLEKNGHTSGAQRFVASTAVSRATSTNGSLVKNMPRRYVKK